MPFELSLIICFSVSWCTGYEIRLSSQPSQSTPRASGSEMSETMQYLCELAKRHEDFTPTQCWVMCTDDIKDQASKAATVQGFAFKHDAVAVWTHAYLWNFENPSLLRPVRTS
jgi:hypothetical protein